MPQEVYVDITVGAAEAVDHATMQARDQVNAAWQAWPGRRGGTLEIASTALYLAPPAKPDAKPYWVFTITYLLRQEIADV